MTRDLACSACLTEACAQGILLCEAAQRAGFVMRENEMTTGEILRRAGVTREELGRKVREQWIAWARQQQSPRETWTIPYDHLHPDIREAACRVGEELFCAGWEARLP